MLHMKFGFDWPSTFREDICKWWTMDGWTDGWAPDNGNTISSPGEPAAQVS